MNAIIYCRVSTDEQADKGFSLKHQKETLENYCNSKGHTILKCFIEDYSAKNFENRPEWKKLMTYVKANKKSVDAVFFTRWDRFSRNTEQAYTVIRQFKDMGIEINSTESPLNIAEPDSKMLLAISLAMPEIENQKISIRTKEGLRRALKEGCYMGGASPFGYIKIRNEEGKSTLTPHPELSILVKKVFAEYAKGIYSTEDIRKKYYHKGLKMSKNGFTHLLKNVMYTGKIYIPEWKKEPEMIVEGLHDAIVDCDTFAKVQQVMAGKCSKPRRATENIVEQLPLRGFLLCPNCGRVLTGSASKGRNGVISYWYYHCNPPCKVRYKINEVHSLFSQLLDEFSIQEDQIKVLYKKILAEIFQDEGETKEVHIQSLKRELGKLQSRLESVEQKFFDDMIDVKTYNDMKRKIEVQLGEIKMELEQIKSRGKDFQKHLEEGISIFENVNGFYENATIEGKRQIIKSIFNEKLIYTPKYFKTSHLDETIKLVLTQMKKLKFLRVK